MSNTIKHLIITMLATLCVRMHYPEVHTLFFVLSNCITWELAQNWGRLWNRIGSIVYDLITDIAGILIAFAIIWIGKGML